MVSENTKQTANTAVAKSFKSPLFLVIAICLSVMFVLTLISTFVGDMGLGLVLGLIFLGVSTLCAWLLYATKFGGGKVKNLRLYMAYSKVMTTIAIVLVSIVAALVVAGCIILTAMGDIMKNEIVPMLEDEVKPQLEAFVESMDMAEEEIGDLEQAFEDMPQEIKDMFNLQTAEDFKQLFEDYKEVPQQILDSWDDIINFLNTSFLTITIIVALVFALILMALTFVSSAFKRTSKYLKALGKDVNTDKKAPFIKLFIGGAFIAIGGLLVIGTDVIMGLNTLVYAATIILFAIFFKEMNEARKEEAAELAAAVEAPVEEAPVEETLVEEAPAEETPVEEAPVEETPVDEAPAEETPVEEAPAEEVPTEEAPVEASVEE